MDSIQEISIDGIRVNMELEAEDTLAVRLKRLELEGPEPKAEVRSVLEKQTRGILEQVQYLDGELGLIEVDGVSNAVQIRSKKPEAQPSGKRYAEVVLRGGNQITVEAHGAPLHVSKENYKRLIETLADLLK